MKLSNKGYEILWEEGGYRMNKLIVTAGHHNADSGAVAFITDTCLK